jgi:hypothetical protein
MQGVLGCTHDTLVSSGRLDQQLVSYNGWIAAGKAIYVQLLVLLKMNFKKKKKSTTESIGNCCCCFVETPSANPSPLSLHQAWLYIPGESRSNGPGTAKNMDRSSAADVASS